jgi:hypothetical protein
MTATKPSFIPQGDARFTHRPTLIAGQHYWILIGMWTVDTADWFASDTFHASHDKLSTITGPGCYWCKERLTQDSANTWCPGHVS